MSLRWTWGAPPSDAIRGLARQLEVGWTPGEDGLIKRGAGRSVWRVAAGGCDVLLKHFIVPPARRLLHFVRGSRAAAEYRAARAYGEASIPTAPPIGFGERRAGGLLLEAFYLGRFLPEAVSCGEWTLDAARDGRDGAVRGVVRDALSLLARMHCVPWRHRDLHANNLLRQPDGTLIVIDLHSVHRVQRITPSIRRADVARLLFSFREALDLREAEDLLPTYLEHAGGLDTGWISEAVEALDRFERDYVRGRTARCVRHSTLYTSSRAAGGLAFRRRSYAATDLESDVRAHDSILARGGPEVLGSAERTRVTIVDRLPVADARSPVGARVVKDYGCSGLADRLRQQLGRGRPRSAWTGARRLEVLDIPTAPALALVERPDGSAILVTGALLGAVSLRAFLEGGALRPSPGDRAQVLTQVGWLVGRLGRAGIRHDDLSTKNVLLQRLPPPAVRDVRDRPPDGGWRASLIDLDNLRLMPRHDAAGLTRMLTQLCDVPEGVTRTDRLRFERAYSRATGQPLPREVVDAARAGATARARRRREQARRSTTEAARLGDSSHQTRE